MIDKKHQLLKNAILSLVQVVIIGVSLFFLYRFLFAILGPEQLGVWALVLGTTSVSKIADLGFSGSVIRFVAKYSVRNNNDLVSKVIQTSLISTSISSFIILSASYPLIRYVLRLVLDEKFLQQAYDILPFALCAFWFMGITRTVTSSFDGFHRIDIRNVLLISWTLLHLVLSFILAPRYGLMGMAYSRLIANIIMALASWFLLRKFFRYIPIIPVNWNTSVFKEIFVYGLKIQGNIAAWLLYDPIIKIFLTKFGGIDMVGFFEMASRMILQFRALIVTTNQTIIPMVVDLKEKKPEKIVSFYKSSYRLLFFLSILLFSLIIVLSPIISFLWIGYYEETFVFITIMLAIGWFINSLSASANSVNVGTGELNPNLVSSFTIAVLNAVLSYLFGLFANGNGVITGWIIALIIGSNIVIVWFYWRYKIHLKEIVPQNCIATSIVSGLIILFTMIIHLGPFGLKQDPIFNIVLAAVFSAIFVFLFLINPIKKSLFSLLKEEFLKRKS